MLIKNRSDLGANYKYFIELIKNNSHSNILDESFIILLISYFPKRKLLRFDSSEEFYIIYFLFLEGFKNKYSAYHHEIMELSFDLEIIQSILTFQSNNIAEILKSIMSKYDLFLLNLANLSPEKQKEILTLYQNLFKKAYLVKNYTSEFLDFSMEYDPENNTLTCLLSDSFSFIAFYNDKYRNFADYGFRFADFIYKDGNNFEVSYQTDKEEMNISISHKFTNINIVSNFKKTIASFVKLEKYFDKLYQEYYEHTNDLEYLEYIK